MKSLSSLLLLFLLPAITWSAFIIIFDGVTVTVPTAGIALNSADAVGVDTLGNVYISDAGNNRIVKVTPAGVASVVPIAGLTLRAPGGVVADGSGNIFIADSVNNRVVKVSGGNGTVIATTGLTLSNPLGVAVDGAGTLYIADSGNHRIVTVTAGGTAAAVTITGLGTPLATIYGVAVDPSGNIFVADPSNQRIVEVAPGGAGTVLAIANLPSPLSYPVGVGVDLLGNVYIADLLNNNVVKVTPNGQGTVLNPGNVTLGAPRGVTVSVNGAVYVADVAHNALVEFSSSTVGFGEIQVGAGTGKTLALPFDVGILTAIGSVKVFTQGSENLDFTVASGGTCTNGVTSATCVVNVQFLPTSPGLRTGAVVVYDQCQNPLIAVPLYGTGGAPLAALSPGTTSVVSTGGVPTTLPYQLAFDGASDIYAGNYNGQNVVKVAAGGGSASVVDTGGETLNLVTGVALNSAGDLFIGDHINSRIVVVTADGLSSVLTINGLPVTGSGQVLNEPTALAFDAIGNLYIADWQNNRVVKVSSIVTGSSSFGVGSVIGTGSFTLGSSGVTGVAVDAAGTVYIVDRTSNRIVKVLASGAASLLVPSGITPALSNPQGVAVDAMGNVYIVDSAHARIVEITTAGVASVLQTPGIPNPATLGSNIFGASIDPSGNVFLPDFTNSRIVKVNVSASALTFASTKVGSTSIPLTTTVTNLGNEPLIFASTPPYTPDFSQNVADTNLCALSATVIAGMDCDVSVLFAPQSVASLAATITTTNNSFNVTNATQNISVSGTGLVGGDTTSIALTTNPTSVGIGQPLVVTATLSDTTAGHTATIPTGSVNFTDTVGATTVTLNGGNPVALAGGQVVLPGVTLTGIGTHTITALYGGVTNTFLTSTKTTTLTVSKDTSTIAGPVTQPVQIETGQAGSIAVTAAQPYRAVSVPTGLLTFTILNSENVSVGSGTVALAARLRDSAAIIAISDSLPAGAYTVSVTYGGDANYAASSTPTSISVQVGQIAPAITFTSSANPVLAKNAVTFTATLTSGSGTPTGTVSFYDGTVLLGSVTLVQGVAAFTTSVVAAGANSITAVYAGDSEFVSVTSSAISQTVNDFALNVSTGSSSAATTLPGGTATYALLFSPASGNSFPAAVTLTVTGLPVGATATLTPQILPAGAGSTNVSLAVHVPAQAASRSGAGVFAVIGILLLPFGGRIRKTVTKRGRKAWLAFLIAAGILAAGLCGCSRSSGYLGQQSTAYTLTVTGTSGTLAHSTTIILTVQ